MNFNGGSNRIFLTNNCLRGGYPGLLRRYIFTSLYVAAFVLTGCRTNHDNKTHSTENRLASSSSPYLKEHADNPVDWYEWSPEALEKAKRENKPLIISIGYASCHWCHVMERESFMDTAVARIMNQNFVCIKIDREERPDIDQIYMQASHLISGNGGWPLNAFALPDGKPFYTVTYVPQQQWKTLLNQVDEVYRTEKEKVVKQAEELTKGVQEYELIKVAGDTIKASNRKAYQNIAKEWKQYFDLDKGGLAGSPKFPMPSIWEFLLQHHYLTNDKNSIKLVTATLDHMSNGGIYDHLAGGFSRYSTDDQWKIPHFEKMLYDNGQLVSLYAHAYQVTRKERYAEVIRETLSFIKSDMTSPDGGFYSSINADSEGEEGKFYCWTQREIETIAGPHAKLFKEYFQVADSGNWEHNKNILYTKISKEEFAKSKGITTEQFQKLVGETKQHLLQKRKNRIHPSTDDKILVSWNALMMKGYLDAYLALGEQTYLESALKNAQFLKKNMITENGRLWRNYKDGQPSVDAFLEDYALLARSFILLYQTTFDIRWLEKAKLVTSYAVTHFRDPTTGLFYFTSDESENLVARKMELADNVMPSSNAVFAEVLYVIGEYYGLQSYKLMSYSMLNTVITKITTDGPVYSSWANLLGIFSYDLNEVAVMGENAHTICNQIMKHYNPTSLFMGGVTENLPLLENKLVAGQTMIYICRNKVCKLPLKDVDDAIEQLRLSPNSQ